MTGYITLRSASPVVSRLAFGAMTFTAGIRNIGAAYKVGGDLAGQLVRRARMRRLLVLAGALLALSSGIPVRASAGAGATESRPSAAERLSQPGPEDKELATETGTWKVISTLRLTPNAKPIVSNDLIAVRKMVGNYQQEVMKPAPESDAHDFRRIAYLHYFRVEGCWQYVSMDTRFPVGIMPAKTCEKAHGATLTLEFESLPFVGLGTKVEGRTVNSNLEITRDGPDHEFIRQYWTRADGTGRRWLAVQYEYTRAR